MVSRTSRIRIRLRARSFVVGAASRPWSAWNFRDHALSQSASDRSAKEHTRGSRVTIPTAVAIHGVGFATMCAFVDHGGHGTGETLAVDLRPGNASPWSSADHIATLDAALAQLPGHERGQVLVHADNGAASKAFFQHISDLGLAYSICSGQPMRSRPPCRRGHPGVGLASSCRRRRRTT